MEPRCNFRAGKSQYAIAKEMIRRMIPMLDDGDQEHAIECVEETLGDFSRDAGVRD